MRCGMIEICSCVLRPCLGHALLTTEQNINYLCIRNRSRERFKLLMTTENLFLLAASFNCKLLTQTNVFRCWMITEEHQQATAILQDSCTEEDTSEAPQQARSMAGSCKEERTLITRHPIISSLGQLF